MSSVTESLSRGLADRAVAVLDEQGRRYYSQLRSMSRRICNKKGLGQYVRDVALLGERSRLIQVVGKTPNERQACICQFVPSRSASEREIRFDLCQYVFSIRGAIPGQDWRTAVVVNEHAVERLFLRLDTLDLGAVFDELHDAMLLAIPTAMVARSLGLRQVALPSSSGTFLCDVGDSDGLIARTWLSESSLNGRWHPVVRGVRDAIGAAGGERLLAEFLALGIAGPLADQVHTVPTLLHDVFGRFEWLHEPYSRRPDPAGEVWEQARRAAEADLDRAAQASVD